MLHKFKQFSIIMIFSPASNQRRWVRGNTAAIRGRNAWVFFHRNDHIENVMFDAPYDHNDAGEWRTESRSFWVASVGVRFNSLDSAQEWVNNFPS